jgi:MFS family permease
MGANAVGYVGFLAVVAVSALLASEIGASDSLAGIPSAAATIGVTLAAAPLALRSKRRGRRSGLIFGYLIGVAGGVLGFFAGQASLFWLLVPAMFLFGIGHVANLQNRFAAADLADEDSRARSIAVVVWMGTIGGVFGPALALWANRIGMEAGFGEWVTPFFLGAIGFTLSALVIGVFLRPDPLVEAGEVDSGATGEHPIRQVGRALRVIWPIPKARLALTAMAVSQMAMVAVMTMTPLHMKDHGHAELSTIVIAVHVLGMFGLSPLIGRWADRFGRVQSLMVGAGILGIGTVASVVAGYIPGLMFVGLFLLGLGWSFALIGGSALLTESVPAGEKLTAQGLADVLMSGLGALAALLSGLIKQELGFHWLANFATIAAVLMFVTALSMKRRQDEQVGAQA